MPPWLDRLQRGALLATAFLYSAGYATVGLLAVLLTVIMQGAVQRRVPWRRSALDILIVAFVGIFLLSGIVSDYKPMAIASTGLAALTIYLALGTASRTLAGNDPFLRPLLWAWLLGGTLAALVSIVIHVQTGTPAHTPALGQNAVGTTMLIATFIGLGLFMVERTAWRYAAAGAGALAWGALALTYTRGAWLGFLLGIAMVVLLGGRRAARGTVLAVLLVGLTGAIIAGPERSSLFRRALTIPRVTPNLYRVYLFRSAAAIFADHPLLGTGMNTFPMVYPRYRFPGDVNDIAQPYAHNVYVNMAAEGGILGLAAFLAILGRALQFGWRWRASATTREDLALRSVLVAAFAAMLGHQAFDGTLISVHLGAGMWMFIAMLTSSGSLDA